MTAMELGKGIPHMEDKMIDYSEKLLNINRSMRCIQELLLSRNGKAAVDKLDDVIIDAISMKAWIKYHDKN